MRGDFKKSKGGFTLIELILYVGVAALILLAISVFLSLLLEARIHNQVISEVEEQGRQVLQLVTLATRQATAINSPGVGGTGTTLSLIMPDPNKNPTVFSFGNGALTMQEGPGAVVPLTNNRVIVSGMAFKNISRPNTPGIVRLEFTLSHINNTGRTEYNYAQVFRASAGIRK